MATTYNVYRDGAKIKSGLTTTKFTDTGLTAGKEYAYQVSSVNEVGESPLSEKVFVTIRSVTLDVNGTVKTGTFAEKTLDEDAYDDLTVKDSNTVYKVYPDNGNPDEAAWFLGEQPVDSAKEGDTVVYGRNFLLGTFGTHKISFIKPTGVQYRSLYDVHSKSLDVGEEYILKTNYSVNSPVTQGKIGLIFDVEPYMLDGATNWTSMEKEGVFNTKGIMIQNLVAQDLKVLARIEINQGADIYISKSMLKKAETFYTVAPEDVAMIAYSTGGGAA